MPRYAVTALIVACALFMETLDSTVIATSLPAIAADLGEDPISLKLALTSYLVSLAVFIPASGWVADRYGARLVFRLAIAIFTLASIGCGLASTLPELVLGRLAQGLGGAMMVPVGRLLLMRSIDRGDLVRALSYLTVPALFGPVAGPLLGGFITTYFHWRWIFWINAPIGVLGIVLASIFIEDVREENPGPLDVLGFILSGVGLSAILFGLAAAGGGLASEGLIGVLVAVGAAALIFYLIHARRAASPLLDLKLLRLHTFRASVLGGALFRVGIGSIPFLLPLMLQVGFGYSAFQSGSVTFIASAGALLMKTTAAPILRRFGFRRVLVQAALISGCLLMTYGFFTPATPTLLMMGVLLVSGFVNSLQFTGLNAIAYAEIDTADMSRAVSFSSVIQQLSLSLGIAAGAAALQGWAHLHPGEGVFSPGSFAFAFVMMGLLGVSSAAVFIRLPPDAGAELNTQRSRSGDDAEAAH
ncbi:DHA2 family efflux MFS transporter permease subunit [Methylocella silvestris]|uniref:MFS transporter n=1 Tax=Methylocella silvestris TaxID=199596 RepID=A0A2J7TK78_METSI|nr:DHA2 family efflux MFS transporter permease subunit [Methylocella silvestris]PNG27168.1 MFS transporter [Methylocella silvestris]